MRFLLQPQQRLTLTTLPAQRFGRGAHPAVRLQRKTLRAASAFQPYAPPSDLVAKEWLGDEAQVQALQQLRERVAGTSYAGASEELLRWFLLDRKLNDEDAFKKLGRMMDYRRSIG